MNARLVPTVAAAVLLGACSSSSNTAGSPPAPATASMTAVAKPFEYVPGTSQYRYKSDAKVTQSMMGQSQEATTSAGRLMTIALSRLSRDTLSMTVTIDSLTGVGPMGMPVMGIDKVVGMKFNATMSPNGEIYTSSGPSESENLLASQMTDEIVRALPRLKGTLTRNATWTDTIKDKVTQQGLVLEREVIARYNVDGDTTVAGEPAWKLSGDYVMKAGGKGNHPQAGELSATINGSGKRTLVVSKKDVVLGGVGDESTVASVTVAMNGMQIGITTSTTTSFSKVK